MSDFALGRAVTDAAHRKRGKYMAKCAAIGYGFLPFSFSSLGELEIDAATLLRRVRNFSMAQDIVARAPSHIFNRIGFSFAKGVLGFASFHGFLPQETLLLPLLVMRGLILAAVGRGCSVRGSCKLGSDKQYASSCGLNKWHLNSSGFYRHCLGEAQAITKHTLLTDLGVFERAELTLKRMELWLCGVCFKTHTIRTKCRHDLTRLLVPSYSQLDHVEGLVSLQHDGFTLSLLDSLFLKGLRTVKSIPPKCRLGFSRVLKGALDKVICKPNDIACGVSLLVLYLCLLKTFCPRSNLECKCVDKRQRQEESITNAIQSWGVPGGSLQLVRETLAESASPMIDLDEEDFDLNERNLKQCKRKICDGHYTAAVRVLSSFGVAPYNDATLQELKAKHPFKSAPSLLDIPIDHHHLIASQDVVLDRIKSFPRGGGVCPIAVGTVWRCLVSKVSATMIGYSLDGYLDGLQFGVGVPGGGEAIIHVTWYLDDGTIVGDTLVVGKVLELITEDGPRCGLHLNVDKTELFWPKEDPRSRLEGVFPPNISRLLHGVKLLGGLISMDADFSSALVMKRVLKTIGLLDVVAKINDRQSYCHGFWTESAALRTKLLRHVGIVASGSTFDDALCVFNNAMEIDFLVRCSPIFYLKALLNLFQSLYGDIYGDHTVSCAGIIGIKHQHNAVRDTLVDICFRSGILAGKEVDIGICGDGDKALRPADMLFYSWDGGLDVCVDLTGSSPLTWTGMADFAPGRAVIDAVQRKRRELETDAVTLLKRIHNFSMAQDIGARVAHIFNRISFAIAKRLGVSLLVWGLPFGTSVLWFYGLGDLLLLCGKAQAITKHSLPYDLVIYERAELTFKRMGLWLCGISSKTHTFCSKCLHGSGSDFVLPPDCGDGVVQFVLYDLPKPQVPCSEQLDHVDDVVHDVHAGFTLAHLDSLFSKGLRTVKFIPSKWRLGFSRALKGALDKVICKPDDISYWVGLLALPLCLLKTFARGVILSAILSSSGVAPYSDVTLKDLKTKHPFKPAPSLPHIPLVHHHLIAFQSVVLDKIKSFSRGTSCRWDGLRAQHLIDCLSGYVVAVSDELVSSITQVVNLFLDGSCSKMLGEYIASASLTLLVKPGGGIRSIVVGTVWRRLVSKVSALMIGHSLDGYLDDLQFGVGVSGVIERLCCKKFVSVVLLSRVEWNSITLTQLHCITGSTPYGRDKGCTKVLELIMEDGPRYGLHLNVDETEVFWPTEDPRSRDVGVFPSNIARPTHGIKLLSGPVSVDFDFCSQLVMKRVAKTIGLMEAMAKIDDPQCELLFLRSCTGISKLYFSMRTCSSGFFVSAQRSFDVALRSSFERIVTASGPGFGD
ncbi:hypothetical protein Tco_0335085 [Tanacetum coccineum]